MARPPGRSKTARLTVNLEPQEYASLRALARREDVPLEEYLEGGIERFKRDPAANGKYDSDPDDESSYYRMAHPGVLWDGTHGDPLPADGGIKRPAFVQPARPARTRPGAISGSETGGKAAK